MNSQLVMACAVCAREAGADAAFCSRCGSKLFLPESATSLPAPRTSSARTAGTARPVGSAGSVGAAGAGMTAAARGESGTASLLALLSDTPAAGHAPCADPVTTGSWSRPQQGGRSSSTRAPLLLALVASVLAALVVGLVVRGLMATPPTVMPSGSTPAANPAATPAPSAPSASAVASSPAAGAAAPVQATATVPSTSPNSRDAAGDVVSYAASQMLDADPSTAWRMDGDGTGTTLTFTFPAPRRVSSLGLVNGYAKVDPTSGADRYTQERRLVHVTWTVDGHAYPQTLADGDRSVQSVPVGGAAGVTASSVTLRLDATTAPAAPAFDKTAISDIAVG